MCGCSLQVLPPGEYRGTECTLTGLSRQWAPCKGHVQTGPAPGFFRTGVMMAAFCEVGRQPSWRELLHMTQMNGRSVSTTSRRIDVGSGSRTQLTSSTGEFLVKLSCAFWERMMWRLRWAISLFGLVFFSAEPKDWDQTAQLWSQSGVEINQTETENVLVNRSHPSLLFVWQNMCHFGYSVSSQSVGDITSKQRLRTHVWGCGFTQFVLMQKKHKQQTVWIQSVQARFRCPSPNSYRRTLRVESAWKLHQNIKCIDISVTYKKPSYCWE